MLNSQKITFSHQYCRY